jgi:hypothetical protein
MDEFYEGLDEIALALEAVYWTVIVAVVVAILVAVYFALGIDWGLFNG